MFNKRQKEAHRLALDYSVRTLFITGEGGTGKTEVAKQIIKDLKALDEDISVIAPTHSAAKNLPCGQTIASFFKLTPTLNIHAEKEEDALSFTGSNIEYDTFSGQTIIVDEASMIGEKQFNDLLARLHVKKLIVLGDPEQLAPIKDRPFNWEAFCDKTVVLNVNYRTTNPTSKATIDYFLKTGQINLPFSKGLKYDEDTVYIAHKNKVLSDMQQALLGYTTCRLGDELLAFGNCDTHLRADMNTCIKGKDVSPYFVNNDIITALSGPMSFAEGLYVVEVLNTEHTTPMPKNAWAPDKPLVIVGDHDAYKKLLIERFEPAKKFAAKMRKKHHTDNTFELRERMNPDERKFWGKVWQGYFDVKSKPYARHAQFRTTYKSQGKSFENVVVNWDDLPNDKHRYVAISRARNKLEVV